jgi:hypothetical protein
MSLSQSLYAIRWLVWDTFRQSLASGIFWLLLSFSGIAILVCLSIGVEGGINPFTDDELPEIVPGGSKEAADAKRLGHTGVAIGGGELTLGFGAFRIPFPRFRTEAIRHIQVVLAWGVADTLGILLALVFTAGFLPSFLDPAAATVLLTKPVPRWAMLLGKYIGVVILVFLQATVFVVGTWLALGLKTGVWSAAYLMCIPLLLLQFAVFFSVSVLLAVLTRSTVACVFGTILFWLMCWGMNFGRCLAVTVPELGLSGFLFHATEAGYWILPKPVDFGLLLFELLKASDFLSHPINTVALDSSGAFLPEMSIVSSLLFAAVTLALASWELTQAEY